jgi:hypothetical protein
MMRVMQMGSRSSASHKRKGGRATRFGSRRQNDPAACAARSAHTVTDMLADYLANYKRRSGKAIDGVEAAAPARSGAALGAADFALSSALGVGPGFGRATRRPRMSDRVIDRNF